MSEENEPLIAGPSHRWDSEMVGIQDAPQQQQADEIEVKPDEEVIEYLVEIPEEVDTKGFSWRKLWAFTGPGFLMSIAYLDPGNIESDLQSGAVARYQLLWVLLMAHIVGFLLQRLSSRLGVVSGKHMAEVSNEFYPKGPRLFLWVMIEIAIIGSDMQEVIGTSVALYMLSSGKISLLVGVLITMLDTFTFLFIDHFGFRKLEGFFAFLITVMAVSFGFEFVTVKPDGLELIKGIFIPWCSGCGRKELLQGISVVGAVIMPHNLYLHSALVKSRRIDRTKRHNVTEANFYYFVESGIALLCSFIINLFVVAVFAHGLYNRTNAEVSDSCAARHDIIDTGVFPNNNETVEADLYKGGIFLGCEFGLAALYVWGVGILASGQSSTMTGTYAGQFVMEGFIRMTWPRWRRVLVTRLIAILPTLSVVIFAEGVHSLTGMNDLLNCVQMIQLPFALIPIVTFTSSKNIMFDYRSSRYFQFFAFLVSILVIAINMYFSFDYITSTLGGEWYIILAMTGPVLLYLAFVAYLMLACLQTMEIIQKDVFKSKYLKPNVDALSIKPLWMPECKDDPNSSNGYGSTEDGH